MLEDFLNLEGFSVSVYRDGQSALKFLLHSNTDLVILDVILPKKDGLQVLQEFRLHSDIPVLMLTARGETQNRISGLESGADDYLAKPFDPRELLLRIDAILRRRGTTAPGSKPLVVGSLRMESSQRQAYSGDRDLLLTEAEFRILEMLMNSPGKAVSRESLNEYALGRPLSPYDRALDTHVSNLRAKIGRDDRGRTPIRGVRGAGYLLTPEYTR